MVGSAVTVGAMIDRLGTNLIDVVAGRVDGHAAVSGVCIHDPFDPALQLSGAVVLGVGVVGAVAIEEFTALAVEHGAAAVVLREPVRVDLEVLRAAARADVVVLGLIPGVGWNQVATALSAALDEPAGRRGLEDAGSSDLSATDRLSQIANGLADLLGAPITIEDTSSCVLAFSRNQSEGDECRKETILHRQVPRVYVEQMKADGIFQAVYSSAEPVHVESTRLHGHVLSRSVMRIVAGTTVLGSIWAAVPAPLDAADRQLLVRTAEEVAGILEQVQLETGRDASRRRQLVAQLLAGGAAAEEAAQQGGLGDSAFCLMVVAVRGDDGPRADSGSQQLAQVAESLHLHLLSYHRGSAATVAGGVVVGVLPVDRQVPDPYVQQVAQRFLERSRRRSGVHLVLTPVVPTAAELGAARAEAVRTLHVVTRGGRAGAGVSRVHRTQDTLLDVLLMEVRDKLGEKWSTRQTPLRRLLDHDREHHSDLVGTLNAYLTHFGSVTLAAAAVHVHPNTLRYRLTRLTEICGIDVLDEDSRFRALLELKLLELDGHARDRSGDRPVSLRSVPG